MMESQPKSATAGGCDGYQGARDDGGGRAAGHFRAADYVLRVAGVATTLVAAVIMGVAKEDETVQVQLAPGLPSIPFAVTAKASYSSAFVYFVVVNAIASAYAALSLALSAATTRAGRTPAGLQAALFASDLTMVVLLLSGNGAAAAIGVVGRNGNSHVRWNKICNVFGKFCAHVMASVSVSLLGSLAFVLLVLVAFVSAHRRSKL